MAITGCQLQNVTVDGLDMAGGRRGRSRPLAVLHRSCRRRDTALRRRRRRSGDP